MSLQKKAYADSLLPATR